jgi:hypothetical protein
MAAEARTWAVEELGGEDGLSSDEIPRAKIWLASTQLDRQYLLTGTKADVVDVIKCGLATGKTTQQAMYLWLAKVHALICIPCTMHQQKTVAASARCILHALIHLALTMCN